MADAAKLKDPSSWHPITDAVDLKHLAKLNEESGELTSAIARCMIQGIGESEPVTGKPNREWLEDEIADVVASSELVIEHFRLDMERIMRRRNQQKSFLRRWHANA
jgi:NTP pyrophosphatase (non-canonical NTP hydrolase)